MRQPNPRHHLTNIVEHHNVMVRFGPVIANKPHCYFLPIDTTVHELGNNSLRPNEQCSRHDTPSVLHVVSTNSEGTISPKGITLSRVPNKVLTRRQLHTSIAQTTPNRTH